MAYRRLRSVVGDVCCVPTENPASDRAQCGCGINLRAKTAAIPNGIAVLSKGAVSSFAVTDPFLLAEAAGNAADRLSAPMPGLVKSVRVSAGDMVKKGQILLVLEAMKMEHTITAPHDGKIAEIVTESSQVKEKSSLVRFETNE